MQTRSFSAGDACSQDILAAPCTAGVDGLLAPACTTQIKESR